MGQTLTNGVYLPDNGERNCYTGLSQNWQKLDNLIGSHGDTVSFSQTLTEGVEIGKITINGVDIAMYHTDYSDKADADNVYTKAEANTLLNGKADKATTLSGYGITDAYTKAQVENKISELVNSAPETLDTLNELATALGNDPNFATTIANQIGSKANDSDVVHKSGNETISGVKTFSNDIRINKTSPFLNVFSSEYIKGQAPTSNIYSGVRFFDDIDSGSENTITGGFEIEYNRDGYNRSYISSRNYAEGTHKFFTVGLRVPNDNTRSIDFLPSVNSIISLGTPTYKWKNVNTNAINGINPGALSLPNLSDAHTSILGYITKFNDSNYYIPLADGYICLTNNSNKNIRLRLGSSGFYSDQIGAWHSVYIPVRKDILVDIYIGLVGNFEFSTAELIANFYLCQGNV